MWVSSAQSFRFFVCLKFSFEKCWGAAGNPLKRWKPKTEISGLLPEFKTLQGKWRQAVALLLERQRVRSDKARALYNKIHAPQTKAGPWGGDQGLAWEDTGAAAQAHGCEEAVSAETH